MDQRLLECNIQMLQQNLMQLISTEDNPKYTIGDFNHFHTQLQSVYINSQTIPNELQHMYPESMQQSFNKDAQRPRPDAAHEMLAYQNNLVGSYFNAPLASTLFPTQQPNRVSLNNSLLASHNQNAGFKPNPDLDTNRFGAATRTVKTKCYISTPSGLQMSDREISIPVMHNMNDRRKGLGTKRIYNKRPENDDDADPLDDNADDCDYSIEKLGIGFKFRSEHSRIAEKFRVAMFYLNDLAATRLQAVDFINYQLDVFLNAVPLKQIWEHLFNCANNEYSLVAVYTMSLELKCDEQLVLPSPPTVDVVVEFRVALELFWHSRLCTILNAEPKMTFNTQNKVNELTDVIDMLIKAVRKCSTNIWVLRSLLDDGPQVAERKPSETQLPMEIEPTPFVRQPKRRLG